MPDQVWFGGFSRSRTRTVSQPVDPARHERRAGRVDLQRRKRGHPAVATSRQAHPNFRVSRVTGHEQRRRGSRKAAGFAQARTSQRRLESEVERAARRSLGAVAQWCREHRHLPITEQWAALTRKLRGHFAYYGILGNIAGLGHFRYHVTRAWHKWLSRRSGKARIPWERFGELERRYPLPLARLKGTRLVT